jgi:hypothetical protein
MAPLRNENPLKSREPDLSILRFLRWLAERGELEHEPSGEPSGEQAVALARAAACKRASRRPVVHSRPRWSETIAEKVRIGGGYAFLAGAFATSPIGLPSLLLVLMMTVGRTALGPWLSGHLHIVYIGLSIISCLALTGAYFLLRRPA